MRSKKCCACWLRGEGQRSIEQLVGVDRKACRVKAQDPPSEAPARWVACRRRVQAGQEGEGWRIDDPRRKLGIDRQLDRRAGLRRGRQGNLYGQFGNLGSPVVLGSFGREATGASGVSVVAWVSGAGLWSTSTTPATPTRTRHMRHRCSLLAR